MSGLARPELLATTEWLSEHLGRQGVRVLDARWRPDGTGVEVYRAGQIPGARYIDWRVELVDDAEDSDAMRLAAPDRVAEAAARAGIGDGTTVVVYDDTQGLYAARIGGRSRRTAWSRSGSSTAGSRPGRPRGGRSPAA